MKHHFITDSDMKLTNEQKNEIRELLQNYVGRYPSQNKAANSLIGISAGTVSTILNGRYESISDEMFVKLRAQISGQRAEGWQLCRTRMYRKYPLIPTLWMIFEDSTFAFRSGDKHRSRRIYGK